MKLLASAVAVVLVAACAPSSPHATTTALAPEDAPASSCVLPARATLPRDASDGTPVPTSILGAPLATCSTAPLTGIYRDGRCATGPDDVGVHVVCAEVTASFLRFSATRGNDLVTPARGFPGLRPGDRWCLCAARWAEADAAGVAPPVILASTDAAALRTIGRDTLTSHALEGAPRGGAP